MRKLIIFLVMGMFVFIQNSYGEGKSLNKNETIKYLKQFAITLEDERRDGLVTYVFDEKDYYRFKNFEIISGDGWRFSKLGALRLFNGDLKLTWKINPEKGVINIKAKFNPVGKFYKFTSQPRKEYLTSAKEYRLAEKKKAEEKILKDQKKVEEEKKRLEQENIEAQKKAEEEKKRLEQENIEAQKKAEEEKKRLEQENIEAQKKAEEENKRLEQKYIEAQKKAEEENKRLEQKYIEAQKKAEEEKKILEGEKLALQKEIEEQRKKYEDEKKRLEEEILEAQRKLEEEVKFNNLEPKYKSKCQKRIYNDLFEIGSEQYRTCILNKGPEN